MESKGEILIYTNPEGLTQIDVRLENETLWLAEYQISQLFERDRTVIGRHIKKIIKEGELEEKRNVQKMHIPNSDKPVAFFSLDVILSIGYRVNSKRGTQFRIWANTVLKEHLVKGFTLDEKRLKERENDIRHLKSSINILERSIINRTQQLDEAKNLVKIISDFSKGFGILDDYDSDNLDLKGLTESEAVFISFEEFDGVVRKMKSENNSRVFGKEKDESFKSSVAQIYQIFNGKELYPSIEEKAAMLLYLIVKNHSFMDGNKRIAAAAFLFFLDKNKLLYKKNGESLIDGNTLAAVTLMIAESRPEDKNTVVKIVISILNRSKEVE